MLLTFTASSSLKRSISRSIFPTNVRRLPGGGWRDAPDGKNKCVCQKRQNSSGSDLEIVSPCRVGNGEKHRVAGTRAIYRADLAQRRTSTRSKSIEGAIYRQLCGIYWHNSQETTARVNRWPQLSSDCTNRWMPQCRFQDAGGNLRCRDVSTQSDLKIKLWDAGSPRECQIRVLIGFHYRRVSGGRVMSTFPATDQVLIRKLICLPDVPAQHSLNSSLIS